MTSNKRTAINTANWSPELKRLLELLRGNPLEDDVWAFVESLFRLLGHGEGNYLDHDLMEKCAGYAAGMALARFQMPHEVYSQTAKMTAKILDMEYCPDIRTPGLILPVFREVFMRTADYHKAMREFVLADIFYNSVGSVPDLRKYFKDYDVGLDRVLKRIEENTTAEKFGAAEQQMELIYRELAFYLAIAPKPTLHAMVLKSFQTGSLSSIEAICHFPVVAKLSLYSAYDDPPHQDLILAILLQRFLEVETNVWEGSDEGRRRFLAILDRLHSFSRKSMPAYAGRSLTDQLMASFPLIRAELVPMEEKMEVEEAEEHKQEAKEENEMGHNHQGENGLEASAPVQNRKLEDIQEPKAVAEKKIIEDMGNTKEDSFPDLDTKEVKDVVEQKTIDEEHAPRPVLFSAVIDLEKKEKNAKEGSEDDAVPKLDNNAKDAASLQKNGDVPPNMEQVKKTVTELDKKDEGNNREAEFDHKQAPVGQFDKEKSNEEKEAAGGESKVDCVSEFEELDEAEAPGGVEKDGDVEEETVSELDAADQEDETVPESDPDDAMEGEEEGDNNKEKEGGKIVVGNSKVVVKSFSSDDQENGGRGLEEEEDEEEEKSRKRKADTPLDASDWFEI